MLRKHRFRILAASALFATVLTVASPRAGADDAGGNDKSAGDQTAVTDDAHRQELEAELDLLQASDVELQARLTELDQQIAQEQDAVDEAQAVQAEADAEVDRLLVEVRRAERDVERQQALAQDRAVAAYVHPREDVADVWFGSDDFNEAHEKQTLISQVARHDQDVLDDYVKAEDALADRRAEADDAQKVASGAATDAREALAEVEAARAEQEQVEEALQDKIAHFREEVDALAANEDELEAVIDAHATSGDGPTGTESAAGEPMEGPLAAPPPPPATAPPTTAAPTTAPPVTGPGSTSPPTTAPPTTAPPVTSPPTSMSWPCQGPVTSPFGWRWGRMHNGIDIGVPTGTAIHAAASGYVYYAGWMNGYGNTVLIDHGGGVTTLYAHQSSIQTSVGRTVSRGQTIGLSGATGNVTGPHLHFEVRVNNVPKDPMLYL